MKKILSLIMSLCILFSGFIFLINPNFNVCLADNSSWQQNYQMQILKEFSVFQDRLYGTEGEKQAAEYIKTKLDRISLENRNFAPVSSVSINEGVQDFTYTYISNFKSQNLIYKLKSNKSTDKKVIIGCNYDACAYENDMFEENYIKSEAINGSAGSVAVLITLAKTLSAFNLPYNVEFVFFGAGEANNAGSDYYTKGIDDENRQNILCMINIDSVSVGKNLYFYVDEINTRFSDFVGENLKTNEISINEVNTIHLGKTILNEPNKLGIDYTHIAMSSDNINFKNEGINSINVFAGDYDEGIVYGRCEYSGTDSINYTKNDNLEYISEQFGEYEVSNNLNETVKGVISILQDNNFENICLDSQNETKLFYNIFGNPQIIAYLSVVILLIMIAIICYINLKLSVKSYDANIEPEFLNTIISISQHIDESCTDENIPKAVSQVIAHDIKKDKTIKVKRKKKDS